MINNPFQKIAISLIDIYQTILSPDHSWLKARFPYGYCRHYPTCSQYAKEAVLKFGVVKGVYLGLKRIFKCNPFVKPKIDPVPRKFQITSIKSQISSNFQNSNHAVI